MDGIGNILLSLPDELLEMIASYLDFADLINYISALADLPREGGLSPELGRSLVHLTKFNRDPELLNAKMEGRQRMLMDEGFYRVEAKIRACKEETSERLEINKYKICQILRLLASTSISPLTRESTIRSLVNKILRIFSTTHIIYKGRDAKGSIYEGFPHPSRFRKVRCFICGMHLDPLLREMVRFRIMPALDTEGELKTTSLSSCIDPGPDSSDLYVDIEGYLLVRRVLGAVRVEYVEGLAHKRDLSLLRSKMAVQKAEGQEYRHDFEAGRDWWRSTSEEEYNSQRWRHPEQRWLLRSIITMTGYY